MASRAQLSAYPCHHVAFCRRRQSKRSLGWDRGGEPWPTTDCTEGTTDGSQAKGDNIPGTYPAFIAPAAPITTYAGLDVGIDSAQEAFDRMAMRPRRKKLQPSLKICSYSTPEFTRQDGCSG
ncbi:uncharacterized protein LOC110429598 isoform X2 [Sorghum bicolor]|nr:uncharacterized protein LOC110429598 isoform X2 [Sorghum bicolor]OQU78726.1 hypothetical protein SORBI_3008G039401 [Sorghum bicolor]OQU78727.1 hypothetical protein SORBI_3008G039401 [Sorghum bicolor]|eukprot:XP_021301435.1 uncharacterized protein LOC110429598 isoform X2 [Sorghum bicolor]